MNIKSMLVRLQNALDRNDLVDRLILLPGTAAAIDTPGEPLNLIVGYNSSPKSHAALDLALWMAHQTRLATPRKPVIVQVVYVLDGNPIDHYWPHHPSGKVPPAGGAPVLSAPVCLPSPPLQLHPQTVLANSFGGFSPAEQPESVTRSAEMVSSVSIAPAEDEWFKQADQVLWQARCLANEWRGSLKTHLRFGQLGEQLEQVVKIERASLLILGCLGTEHPLVQHLSQDLPCPVLGIPLAAIG